MFVLTNLENILCRSLNKSDKSDSYLRIPSPFKQSIYDFSMKKKTSLPPLKAVKGFDNHSKGFDTTVQKGFIIALNFIQVSTLK